MTLPKVAVLLGVMLGLCSELRAQEWIEFEMIEQSALPIVRARVNGIGGHRMVLDVGMNDLLLDTMLVDGAGMKLVSRGESQEIDYYGRQERVSVAYTQSLELGNAKFELVRTLLIDGEDATGMGGLRSYGRIGRDILEPLRLTVHYPRRLFLLEASPEDEVPPGSVSFDAAGRFIVVPVRLEAEGTFEDATFVLDPGTSSSLLDRRWAADSDLADKKASHARVTLRVGGFHREDTPLLLGEMQALPYAGNPAGVIGADVLSSISLTYDFARDLVWLTEIVKDAS